MVDSINNNANSASSLLRAQQIQQTNAANRLPAAPTINQSRQGSTAPVKAVAVPQTTTLRATKVAVGSNSVLPRGSIVDKLV